MDIPNVPAGLFPVIIRDISDEELSALTWSENHQRNDLTPIERAHAIQRRMAHFGWSQTKVAAHMGLNKAVISNALKVLKLEGLLTALAEPAQGDDALDVPKPLQKAAQKALKDARAGQVAERNLVAASKLLILAPVQLVAQEGRGYYGRPSTLLKTLNGKNRSTIASDAGEIIDSQTESLRHVDFPLDFDFSTIGTETAIGGGEVVTATCDGCPSRIKQSKDNPGRCMNKKCLARKTSAWASHEVQVAQEVTGLPVLKGKVEEFHYGEGMADGRHLMAQGPRCEHLGLKPERYTSSWSLSVKEAPRVRIVCGKKGGCTCQQAFEQQRKQAKASDPKVLAEKAQLKYFRKTFVQPATQAVRTALDEHHVPTWNKALKELAGTWNYGLKAKKFSDIVHKLADMLISSCERVQHPEYWRKNLANLLESLELDIPWTDETPLEPPKTNGKAKAQRWKKVKDWPGEEPARQTLANDGWQLQQKGADYRLKHPDGMVIGPASEVATLVLNALATQDVA